MLEYPIDTETKAKLAKSMFLIGRLAETREVKKWLEAERTRIMVESCSSLDEKEMYRQQGAARVIEEFLLKIESGRDTFEKLNS